MVVKDIWNNGAPRVALVTSVRGIAEALTGQSVALMSDRSITRTRLRLADLGLEPSDPATAVDLFFVPSVAGNYNIAAQNNVEDLKDRLQPYDLAVDLSEMTALYRRGQTPVADVSEFIAEHGEGNRGYLEYRDFLRVITALLKLFMSIRNSVVHGRNIEYWRYEWRSDRENQKAIKNMKRAGTLLPQGDPRFVSLGLDVSNTVTASLPSADQEALKDNLEELVDHGLQTLQSRMVVTDYASDIGGLIRYVTDGREETRYVASVEDMLAKKRAIFKIDTSSKLFESEIVELEAGFAELLGRSDAPLQLVDQYSISGGPEIAGFKSNVDESLSKAYLSQLPEGMAFIKFWDILEEMNDTVTMNSTVNGWYLSNSCLPMLTNATEFGLKAKITSWAVPVLATNSVGLVPRYEDYAAGFRHAISAELGSLLSSQLAPVR